MQMATPDPLMTLASTAPTVGSSLAEALRALCASDSPSPRLDAELLAAHVMGCDRTWLLAHPDAPVGADAADELRSLVARRATGEPIAYIRGYKEWLSLRIRTDARALVPRPETEGLAEAATEEIGARLARDAGPVVAWEVATGSGAVAVALALRFRVPIADGRLRLIATDESPEALGLATENLEAHGVAPLVTLVRADLLAPAGSSIPRPDVVIANLPYLSTAEVAAAAGSLAHEPRVALEGGADGLALLRRFFAELPGRISPGATVLLEVALGQAEAVAGLAPERASTEALSDLGGVPRVVVVRLAE